MRQKLRLAPLWWAGGWLLMGLIVFGSLQPPTALPEILPKDKIMHFGAYGLAAFWFSGMTERSRYPVVAIALLVVGALLEFAQQAMGVGREADWLDVVANLLGIATALGLAYAGLGSWMLRVERRLGLS